MQTLQSTRNGHDPGHALNQVQGALPLCKRGVERMHPRTSAADLIRHLSINPVARVALKRASFVCLRESRTAI